MSGAGTLTIDGTGQNITISRNNLYRVIRVNSGANLTLQNLTITSGKADGYGGGGVYNEGTLNITDSTFTNNTSPTSGGGGLMNYSGTVSITRSSFRDNSAYVGGGVYNLDTASALTLTSSTLSGNRSTAEGGGVMNDGGSLSVANSSFLGNRAGTNGGGVYNTDGTLIVTNSTFSGNSATTIGGGIRVFTGMATIKNTIIANSASGGDCAGTLSGSNINNLIEDSTNACGLSNGVNGNIIGVDPNLGTLTGSPAYYPLNPGSPAIDAGDNPTCAAPPVSNQSQNGVTRPQGARCDIGAYEAARVFLPLTVR